VLRLYGEQESASLAQHSVLVAERVTLQRQLVIVKQLLARSCST
jgi:hypothetical protein